MGGKVSAWCLLIYAAASLALPRSPSLSAFKFRFQAELAPLHHGAVHARVRGEDLHAEGEFRVRAVGEAADAHRPIPHVLHPHPGQRETQRARPERVLPEACESYCGAIEGMHASLMTESRHGMQNTTMVGG